MDIKSVTKDYVECASGGAVTAPNNGSLDFCIRNTFRCNYNC